jgi:hypothetical protein
MTAIRFKNWSIVRHRKSIAMAVAGWMSLSLVLAFWPCCQAIAEDRSSVTHVEAGDHAHANIPPGTDDPCRTWLDTTDAALNTSPDVLLSKLELKVGHAVYAIAHDFPAVAVSSPGRHVYHSSPPNPLPLYLRVQHLLI